MEKEERQIFLSDNNGLKLVANAPLIDYINQEISFLTKIVQFSQN